MVLGRIVGISFDLVLVSAFLAGVKRSTGLTVRSDNLDNKDVKVAITKYLDIGEWVFDSSVSFMSTSQYFTRKP